MFLRRLSLKALYKSPIKEDLSKYKLKEEVIRTLYGYSNAYLRDGSAHGIALAGFHPGYNVLNSKLVDHLAHMLHSDVQRIDFPSLLDVRKETAHTIKDDISPTIKTINKNIFRKPFSPSDYSEPNKTILEEEEEEEDDMDDTFLQRIIQPMDPKSMVISVMKVAGSDNYEVSMSPKSNGSDPIQGTASFKSTMYHVRLSDIEINSILSHLKDHLIEMYKQSGKRLILYLDDFDDILYANDKQAKHLFLGLNAVVADLKSKKIPILLMTSSRPTLLNPLHLNLSDSFYTKLLTDAVQGEDGKLHHLYSNDGYFTTCFTDHNPYIRNIGIKPDCLFPKNEDGIPEFLKLLQHDLTTQISNVNIKSLKNECLKKGYKCQDLSELKPSTHVWSLDFTRRVLELASGLNEPRENTILAQDIQQALDLKTKLYATPIDRPKRQRSRPTKKKEEANTLKQLLQDRQIQLNSYEKKLLGTVVDPDQIKTTFDEVVLPNETKTLLQTLVTLPILRPDVFRSGILSRHSINGVLLFGPPGTGKTLLAKTVAKSCGARFMNVALSDLFEKYVGEGEKNVKAVFSLARKIAPCIIFVDEVDALFSARTSEGSYAARRELINEFMAEWDGLASQNQGIVILGATNRPFDLDDAILRRMPRRLLVDIPLLEARKKILNVHLKQETLKEVDIDALANKTNFYSGSDLKNLCVAAALERAKEYLLREVSPNVENPIEQLADVDDWMKLVKQKPEKNLIESFLLPSHFETALKQVPPSLTEEAESLIELRKWNAKYGQAATKKSTHSWGFQ